MATFIILPLSTPLHQVFIASPLGVLQALANGDGLYHLAFTQHAVVPPINPHIPLTLELQHQLQAYFQGTLQEPFSILLHPRGTPFQQQAWSALQSIPYGATCSYRDQAKRMGHPTAYRAAAQANGANPWVIIVPCHRVIAHQGGLGGYAAGVERKIWLLNHEKRHSQGNALVSREQIG